MSLYPLEDARMDGVIDGRARKAANFEQIAAFRLELPHLVDFLLTHVLEVDHDAVGAGLSDDPVERDDHDPRIAGLLYRAIESVRGRRIDDDGVVALQDKVLDLGRLCWDLLVRRREDVGGRDD